MIARNRLLLGLIKNDLETTSLEKSEAVQERTITQGKLEAPEPEEEELTPRQEYMNIIKFARKKPKKGVNVVNKKKKVVRMLISFFEAQFPILDDEEDIF